MTESEAEDLIVANHVDSSLQSQIDRAREALTAAEQRGWERGMRDAVKIAQGGNKDREPWNGHTIAKAIRSRLSKKANP